MPYEMIRRQWERNFMAMEYMRHRVEPHLMQLNHEQVQGYYDKHPEEFSVEDSVRWQDLFIATANHPSVEAARQFAEVLRSRILSGEDFARLSKQFDNGVRNLHEDSAGEGQKRGEIRPGEAEPVVFALKSGQVGPLVVVPAGFHVVRVIERTHAGKKPLDATLQKDIKERLRMQIYTREMKRLVSDLKRRAVIEVANEIK